MSTAFYVIKKIKLLDCGFDTDALAAGGVIIHPTDPLYNFLMTTLRKSMFGIPRGDKDISATCQSNEFALLEFGLSLVKSNEVIPSIPQKTDIFMTVPKASFEEAELASKRRIVRLTHRVSSARMHEVVLTKPSVKFVTRANGVMHMQLHYAHVTD